MPSEHETVGDLGCAQPLAMLDSALRRAAPGELILVAAFGSGCDALLLRRTDQPCDGPPPDNGRGEKSYMKLLSFTGQIDLEWGMRAEMDNKTALTAARVAVLLHHRRSHSATEGHHQGRRRCQHRSNSDWARLGYPVPGEIRLVR